MIPLAVLKNKNLSEVETILENRVKDYLAEPHEKGREFIAADIRTILERLDTDLYDKNGFIVKIDENKNVVVVKS